MDVSCGTILLQEIQRQAIMHLHQENLHVGCDKKTCDGSCEKSNFVGFVIRKRLSSKADIGFSMQKLNANMCCCTGKEEQTSELFVDEINLNVSKSVVHTSLNRKNIITAFLKRMCKKEDQGRGACLRKKELTIFCHIDNPVKSTTNLRILLSGIVYSRILSKRYNVGVKYKLIEGNGCALGDAVQDGIENMLMIDDALLSNGHLNPAYDCESMAEQLAKSNYLCNRQGTQILVDGNACIAMLNETGTYMNGIENIEVVKKDGEFTQNLQYALKMRSVFDLKTDVMMHLVPSKRLYKLQCSTLLLQMLHQENHIKQKFCVCEEQGEIGAHTVDDLLSSRKQELWKSYRMKYGRNVSGKQWEETIQQVAVASLKLELYSIPINCKLKGESSKEVSRSSLFILYNYARLCKVVVRFHEKVSQGFYPPLPESAQIDFTLLTEELEWDIILKYLLTFDSLMESISTITTSSKDSSIHQIPQFLSSLSRDMSSYYHQTKILLDPRPHLFPLMFARLYLAMTLKQIMKVCFDLLGITPPEQM